MGFFLLTRHENRNQQIQKYLIKNSENIFIEFCRDFYNNFGESFDLQLFSKGRIFEEWRRPTNTPKRNVMDHLEIFNVSAGCVYDQTGAP